MPKIIENLENNILEQAKIELFDKGYANMTMRSVADACGIAVGTVYNYYKSKDILVAKIMLIDWNKIIDEIKVNCESSKDIHEGFKFMYDGVVKFVELYDVVWTQYGKDISIRREMPVQFDWLITQLANILDEILIRCHGEDDEYICTFLAEILLNAATKKDFEYENIARVLKRMFN